MRVVARDPYDHALVAEVDDVVRVRDAVRQHFDRAHSTGPETGREIVDYFSHRPRLEGRERLALKPGSLSSLFDTDF